MQQALLLSLIMCACCVCPSYHTKELIVQADGGKRMGVCMYSIIDIQTLREACMVAILN